ncbi:MAG: metallophosphoesterase [Bacilli bacterium]
MRQALLIVFYLLFHLFLCFTLLFWSRKITKSKLVKGIIILGTCIATVLPMDGAFSVHHGHFQNQLRGAGNIWLGIAVYLMTALLFCWILYPFLLLWKKKHTLPFQDKTLAKGVLVFAALNSLIFNIAGSAIAQHPKVVDYTVDLAKEDTEKKNLDIVLLTDLHLGVNTRVKTIDKAVDTVKNLHPDLVLIGGDIFTSSFSGVPSSEHLEETFKGMSDRIPTYFVYGNHDVEEGLLSGFAWADPKEALRSKEMEDFVSLSGFRDLNDKTMVYKGVQFAGRKDMSKTGDGTNIRLSPKDLLAPLDHTLPTVVLEHEPVEYKELKEAGANLVLGGHTHAGQIWPGTVYTALTNPCGSGMKMVDGVEAITSSGLGFYGPPIRTGCISEISYIHLQY